MDAWVLLSLLGLISINKATFLLELKIAKENQHHITCKEIETALQDIVLPAEKCIFISTELIGCDFSLGLIQTVDTTMDEVFNKKFVLNYQRKQACNKVVVVVNNWQNLKNHISNYSFDKNFHPLTRIGFLIRNAKNLPNILSEVQIREIYLNALIVVWIKRAGNRSVEIENVITKKQITFDGVYDLQEKTKSLSIMKLNPLFDNNFKQNEINISLFNCPPFVIKLNNENNLNR